MLKGRRAVMTGYADLPSELVRFHSKLRSDIATNTNQFLRTP